MNPLILSDQPTVPLVIDLDDTLLRTDLLYEGVIRLLKTNPWLMLLLPFWSLKGRVHLKLKIAENTDINLSRIPFRKPLLEIIQTEKSRSRKIVLASASHESYVSQIAQNLGLQNSFIASKKINLKGNKKLQAIRTQVTSGAFFYAGDSKADLDIWQESVGALAVNPSYFTLRRIKSLSIPYQVIRDEQPPLNAFFKALRVHQWLKNCLIFIPLVAGHFLGSPDYLQSSVLAFVAFSLMASSVYLMNDLLDIEADRGHSSKAGRPFASGTLSIRTGLLLTPLFFSGSIAIAWRLGLGFVGTLFLYAFLNLAYSFKLKRVVATDGVLLAAMYTLRIIAGGQATGIPVSEWLLAFSTFFFFGLALLKRYTETSRVAPEQKIHGRGYSHEDHETLFSLGTGSSLISVLVLTLYLNSDTATHLYSHHERLWLIAPLLLYWISRVWLLARRDLIHDDPVIFAIKDYGSWVTLFLFAVLMAWST